MFVPEAELTHSGHGGSRKPLQHLTARPTQRKERELRDYYAVLLRRKWLILGIVVLTTALVSVYSLKTPSVYEASATLQLDSKEYLYMEDSRGTVLRAYNSSDYQNTQVQLLSNPQLVRQVVLKLDLEHNPAFLGATEEPSLLASLKSVFAHPRPAAPSISVDSPAQPTAANVNELSTARITQLEPYVSRILSALRVQPRDHTNLVTVSMTNSDPQLATQIVDTLSKIFVANTDNYETRGSQEAAETLSGQIANLQTKIKQAEDERLDYLKRHHLPLEKGDGRDITADRLSKLSSELLDAENETKNAQATYAASVGASALSSVPAIAESPAIQAMSKTLSELEQKRAGLIEIYTADWPEVKKLDSEILQVRKDMEQSARDIVMSLKTKLTTATARETRLRLAYENERGLANNQTTNQVSVGSLNQQIETQRQVYNMLIQRQTEMQVNSLDRSNHVGIVTSPVVPSVPVGPPRSKNIAIAFAVSLLMGLGLAFLLDQFDSTLKSVEDISYYTYLPTLALIPARNGNGPLSLKQRVRLRFGKSQVESVLAFTEDLRSPTAEAYRHLRASLLFAAEGVSPRSILVTSGSPFEGKTTTAISTAITLAQSGEQVLLMDCDLRRPRIHRHFNIPNSEGLTTYLSGERDIDSLFVHHQAYPNLKLITAGPTAANPADVLGSHEMRALLKDMGTRFDHVIIDSSPASSFADASIISPMVDGVVLVVHCERSSRGVVRRVKERLQSVGGSICGVVLNHVDISSQDYYSTYYSGYEEV